MGAGTGPGHTSPACARGPGGGRQGPPPGLLLPKPSRAYPTSPGAGGGRGWLRARGCGRLRPALPVNRAPQGPAPPGARLGRAARAGEPDSQSTEPGPRPDASPTGIELSARKPSPGSGSARNERGRARAPGAPGLTPTYLPPAATPQEPGCHRCRRRRARSPRRRTAVVSGARGRGHRSPADSVPTLGRESTCDVPGGLAHPGHLCSLPVRTRRLHFTNGVTDAERGWVTDPRPFSLNTFKKKVEISDYSVILPWEATREPATAEGSRPETDQCGMCAEPRAPS